MFVDFCGDAFAEGTTVCVGEVVEFACVVEFFVFYLVALCEEVGGDVPGWFGDRDGGVDGFSE